MVREYNTLLYVFENFTNFQKLKVRRIQHE